MTSAKPRIQPLETVECFREVAVSRRVLLHYLSDKHPDVHALLVGSEAEREGEVLTRFPNASQHGHHDASGRQTCCSCVRRHRKNVRGSSKFPVAVSRPEPAGSGNNSREGLCVLE
jgi:hypothetical protein